MGQLMRHAGEVTRIPIGEANAAMGHGFADLGWFRRPVNTVRRRGEVKQSSAAIGYRGPV